MRDRQTMGGYQIAGCVAYVDVSLLAQATPGTQVAFVPIDIADIEADFLTYQNFWR